MPSPPLPAPAQLRSYRLLLGVIALGNVAFAAAQSIDGAALYDPLPLRAALSILALLVAAATHIEAVQRHARAMLYAVAHTLVGYATLLCVWNEFQPAYALGYVGVVAALGLGGAMTSRRSGALLAVMVGAVAAPLVALVLVDTPGVGRASFLITLVSTALVSVLVALERTRDRARILGERARYQCVFERATDSMYLADAATRRVLDANPSMLRLTGYSRAEICTLRTDDLVHVEPGEPSLDSDIAAERIHVEPVIVPRRLRTATGALVDVEVGGTVVDLGDGRDTMSLIVRDATERRRAERALLLAAAEADAARARAEELLRLKSSFLSNMSHEIRTPLTGILGYADLLCDEVSGDAQDMVGAVQRSATRLMRTLNSVLDLARLDAGNEAIRTEPVDLVAEAHAAAEALQTVARARGLRLEVDAGEPVWATAESGSVVRILDNLIGNALKFTNSGGVSVCVRQRGDYAELSVVDTGPGIPEAFRPHLFDEFRQASTGHSRSHEGSGLGLALTRRLAERLQGTISVESTEGVGSTFTVSLPATSEKHQMAVV